MSSYCDACNNTGWLDCYCGGDLCICGNHGEYPCPHCDGMADDDCSEFAEPFAHVTPKADACDHDFQGWRPFADGNGGEAVCTKCGLGAMAYTLRAGG